MESQGKRKIWIQLLKNTKEARTKRGKKRGNNEEMGNTG
jgi:hypothetical protein